MDRGSIGEESVWGGSAVNRMRIFVAIVLGGWGTALLAVGSPAGEGLAYLDNLVNQKAACFAKIDGKSNTAGTTPEEKMLKKQEQLAACYQKILIDLGSKFYPDHHFGQDLTQEIEQVVARQQVLLQKITQCPSSKQEGCQFYEQYDAVSGTADYLNELIEFMALNIGEGYPEFNPEKWLKKWEAGA